MLNEACDRTFLRRAQKVLQREARGFAVSAKRATSLVTVLTAAVGIAGLLAVSGCASDPQTLSYYNRDAAIPVSTASGLPEKGASVCLSSTGRRFSSFEVFLRRAIADRGYRVVMLNPGETLSTDISEVCRFHVIFSAFGEANPGEMPRAITLDFRDFYTGESQHADWRRADNPPGFMRTGAKGDAKQSPLIAGPYGDPDMIIRNLVDQLFPTPAATLR